MPPPLLFMRRRSGTNQAALRYQGGASIVVTTLGNTFGTTESSNFDHTPQNHTIQFQGNIYSVGSDGIYEKDDPTADAGTWTQVHTFTSPDATNGRFSGLYAVNISGVPTLIMLYGTTTSTAAFRGVMYDGTSWTQSAEIIISNTISRIKAEIVWRNQLHIIGMDNGGAGVDAIVWNPAAGIISSPTNSFGNGNVGLCVFNDRLYAVHSSGGNAVTSLSIFEGNWSIVVNNFSTAAFSANAIYPPTIHSGNQCLFTDGTNMYCLVSGLHDADQTLLTGGEGGWRCFQFDSALAVTNITTTVLPASLRSAADGGSGGGAPVNDSVHAAHRDRFFSFTDIDTTPGSQTTWLHYSALGTVWPNNFDLYQWNGPGSVMTLSGGIGGSSEHSVASLSTSGGEYIWVAGELDVWITDVSTDTLGTLVSFKASGDAGTSDKTVTFRMNFEGEPAIAQATLVGAATGGSATRSGNSIINVDANGSTTYTIVWDSTTDAPATAWRAGLIPFIV